MAVTTEQLLEIDGRHASHCIQHSQMMATVQNANNTSVVEWNALDNLASDTANNASEEKQCLNVSILLIGHFRED